MPKTQASALPDSCGDFRSALGRGRFLNSRSVHSRHDKRQSRRDRRRLRARIEKPSSLRAQPARREQEPAVSLAPDSAVAVTPFVENSKPFVTSEALQAAPMRALSLPRFHHEVPGTLSRGGDGLDRAENSVLRANIAEALLDLGVLCSSDWKGDLRATIEAGLSRWANDEMKARGLRHYELSLLWCEDIGQSETFQNAQIYKYGDEQPGRAVGAFALKYDAGYHVPTVFVASKVMALEKAAPGAGFAVLNLLDDAARFFAETITPQWAHWWVSEELLAWGEEELTLSGKLTLKEFESSIPEGAWRGGKCAPRVLESALQNKRCTAAQCEILVEAQRLARLWTTRKRFFSRSKDRGQLPRVGCDLDSVVPLCILWNDGDAVSRVADDFFEIAYQSEFTEICWWAGFWSDELAGAKGAVKRLQFMLELIANADRLLHLLHTEPGATDANDPAVVAARENRMEVLEQVRVRV